MAIKNKTQLTNDISLDPGFTSGQKTILTNMVDSYADVFPQIDTSARNALTPTLGQIIFNTDVNAYQYWNGSVWFGIGQDLNTPLVVKVDLSSSDILNLNTTPKTIVAAPGAGYALIPSSMSYRFTYGGVAYSGGSSITLMCSSKAAGSASVFVVIQDAAIKASANRSNSVASGSGSSADSIVENEALVLKTSTAFTNGNGTLTVWVTYSLINY